MKLHLRVIVGDLADNVVEDVSLRDTVGTSTTDPAHNGAKITEQLAVKSGESTTSECELGGAVVRKKRVGVLQERDQHEPVVHPKKRNVRHTSRENEAIRTTSRERGRYVQPQRNHGSRYT